MHLLNLTLQYVIFTFDPFFKLYVKVLLKISDKKQLAFIALIKTRAVFLIIHSNCLLRKYHVPTLISFSIVNRSQFYSHKYTKPTELLSFGERHSFFTCDNTKEDLLFGIDFQGLIAPFTFYPEVFGYIIVNSRQSTTLLSYSIGKANIPFLEGVIRVKSVLLQSRNLKSNIKNYCSSLQKFQISFGLENNILSLYHIKMMDNASQTSSCLKMPHHKKLCK